MKAVQILTDKEGSPKKPVKARKSRKTLLKSIISEQDS